MAEAFVILYHKVLPKWGFDVYYKTFDLEMKILKEFYNVVTLDELAYYVQENKKPSRPTVAITFDDGFADNYVYAYPILKKHRLKATIFPITSRLLRENIVRPTLKDYWEGKVSFNQLHQPLTMAQAHLEYLKHGKSQDFLSVEELNKMKDVFEIGGHAQIHSKVFYSQEIIDFYDGKNGHWSYYYAYQEEPVLGFPILPSKNNLSVNRSFIKNQVKDFVKSLDKKFFTQKDWKDRLKREIQTNFKQVVDEETTEERVKRIKKELENSKNELEKLTNQKIHHFAYPFGHYDEVLVECVKDYFSFAYTTEKKPVEENQNPFLIPRYSIPKDITSFLLILLKAKL